MSVTVNDVKKVCRLARIKISDTEKVLELCDNLNSILTFIEQLNEVDCGQIDETLEYVSTLHERDDIVQESDPAVMDNAPFKECNMFVVPKVVG